MLPTGYHRFYHPDQNRRRTRTPTTHPHHPHQDHLAAFQTLSNIMARPGGPSVSLSPSEMDEETVNWKDSHGTVHSVPQDVFSALEAPYRGQAGFGSQHKFLLSLFHDIPEYHQTLHPKKTCAQNVRTTLVCKYDETLKTNIAFQKINSGKLLNRVLECEKVPDEDKLKLTKKCTAAHGKKWLEQYEKKRKQLESSNEEGLAAAEQDVLEDIDPSAKNRRERQAVLEDFGVQSVSETQARALNFLLGCFLFACRIPFAVVGNYFFRAFITALNPGYGKHWLPGRTQVATTILDDVYEETLVSTEAALDHAHGKRTLGL